MSKDQIIAFNKSNSIVLNSNPHHMVRLSKNWRFVWVLLALPLMAFQQSRTKLFSLEGYAQGTTYKILYYAQDSIISAKEIEEIFLELDSSLSVYKPYSTITKFNNSKTGVAADKHLLPVVKKSIEVYKKSHGIFDITVYPIVEAWGFAAKKVHVLPDSAHIQKLLSCVGSDKIAIRKAELIKLQPCVKIDVNGIAQGYTVDYIADYLEKKRIKNYLVEVGGELRIKGKKANGEFFTVGIESPAKSAHQAAAINKVISIKVGAVTTSGNYRKYVESNGTRISHLLNPKTGFPFVSDIISVTLIAPKAFLADAYDNVLMGMNMQQAVNYVNNSKSIHTYLIYKDINGVVRDTSSKNFKKFVKQAEF